MVSIILGIYQAVCSSVPFIWSVWFKLVKWFYKKGVKSHDWQHCLARDRVGQEFNLVVPPLDHYLSDFPNDVTSTRSSTSIWDILASVLCSGWKWCSVIHLYLCRWQHFYGGSFQNVLLNYEIGSLAYVSETILKENKPQLLKRSSFLIDNGQFIRFPGVSRETSRPDFNSNTEHPPWRCVSWNTTQLEQNSFYSCLDRQVEGLA